MKTCTTCCEDFPLTEFYSDRSRPDGIAVRCKKCSRKAKKKTGRKADLKARYNLSTEEYEYMSFKQGHVCAICGSKSQNNKKLCVDHDHNTNAIRGLLCHKCNTSIGLLKDDADLVLKAYNYLVVHDHNQQQKGNK